MAYFDIETQRRTDNIEKIKITPSNEILPPDTDEFVELLERFRSEIHGKGAVKARECVDKDIDRIKGGLRLQSTDKYMPLLYDVASIFDYAKGYILCVMYLFPAANRILHPAQRMSVHTIHMELSPVFGDLPVRVVFTSSYTKAYVEKPSVANVN